MNNSEKVYISSYQMQQTLKSKGFVFSSENGFRIWSIPGVPFSYHTHLAGDSFLYPRVESMFNDMVENAVKHSNEYLKK